MKPLVIGLTGPIGSGKSHVRSVLVSLGAEGIDADRVAHEVMAPDGPAYPGIVAEFGPAILGAEGLVDRGLLGARVFGDSAALARLEAIVHPAVGQAIRDRVDGFDRTPGRDRGDQAAGSRAGPFAVRPGVGGAVHSPPPVCPVEGEPRHERRRGAPPPGQPDARGADDRPGAAGHPHRRHDRRDGTDGLGRLGRVGAAAAGAGHPPRGAGRLRGHRGRVEQRRARGRTHHHRAGHSRRRRSVPSSGRCRNVPF